MSKSGINIKKANRGKFTKTAKAAGRTVLEEANAVLGNKHATKLQKERANFAKVSRTWNHKRGSHSGVAAP